MKFNKNKIFFQLTFSKLVLILVGILVITSSFAQTTHAAGEIDLHTLTVSAATYDTENIGTDQIKINLDWDGDGGPYDVYEGIVLVADNVSGSSVTLNNLDKGVEHCYTVQYDDDDPVSNEPCSHVQPEIVSLSLTGPTQVTITWTQDPANNPSGTPNGYLVERIIPSGLNVEVCSGGSSACSSGTFQQVTPSSGSTGTSHVDNTVVVGTEYCYEIQADWSPRSDMDSDKACIIIDNTPPTIVGTSTPDGSNGWHVTSPADTNWTCTDEIGGSGVDATSFEAVQSQVADTNSQDFTQTCKDNAGNESVSDTVNVKLDTQKPTIDGTSTPDGSNGWHKTSPAVTNWICNDPLLPGSGVDATSFDAVQSQVTDTNGQDFTQTCKDNAGNESVSDTVNVKLDTIAPSLDVAAADVTFAAFETSGQASVSFATSSFTDSGSGVDPAYPVSSPTSPALLSVGLHDIIHTAKDIAGNEATDTSTANVFDVKFDATPPFAVESDVYVTVIDEALNEDNEASDSVSFLATSAKGDAGAIAGISITAFETNPTSFTFRNAFDTFIVTSNPTSELTGELNLDNEDDSGFDEISVLYTSTDGISKIIMAKTKGQSANGAPASASQPILWSSDTYLVGGSGTPKVFDPDYAGNGNLNDQITVTVSSSGDANTLRSLTLNEESGNQGRFSSPTALSFLVSPAVSNFAVSPPVLRVAIGSTLSLTYDDANANPGDVSATPATIITGTVPNFVVNAVVPPNNICGDGNDDDSDGLCDTWEVSTGLAANRGLKVLRSDSAVMYSYPCRPLIDDTSGNSGLRNTNVCPNPQHKDVYLEIDYMAGHKPSRAALDQVITKFEQADITNPDSAIGITLHIQLDENIGTHYDSIPFAITDGVTDFYDIKGSKFEKATERAVANQADYRKSKQQAFHYVLFGHSFTEQPTSSGKAEINGNDVFVTLGSFTNNVGTQSEIERTLMHELGHNLNLNHGGSAADTINCKPNYLSIMSYAFQFNAFGTTNPMDYSRSALATLDENNLNEATGLSLATPNTLQSFHKSGASIVATGALGGATNSVDWDGDGDTTSTALTQNIHSVGTPCPVDNTLRNNMQGYDDWANVVLNFRGSGEFSDGIFQDPAFLIESGGTANFVSTDDLHEKPYVNGITAPLFAFAKNVPQTFSATFEDPEGFKADESGPESHTASFNWGDGTTPSTGAITYDHLATIDENTATGFIDFPAGHAYTKAGKYEVMVTVKDQPLNNEDISKYPLWMMVYDTKTLSSAGAALGKMPSPAGAYKADTSLVGTAKFVAAASYIKQKPVGIVTWELIKPDNSRVIKLTSKSFDWFIAGGPDKNEAYIKGIAKLEKGGVSSDVGFIASMVDPDKKKLTEPGYFRLKIYELGSGNEYDNLKIIYDNECLDTSPTPDPATPCVRNYEKVSTSQKMTAGSIIVLVK